MLVDNKTSEAFSEAKSLLKDVKKLLIAEVKRQRKKNPTHYSDIEVMCKDIAELLSNVQDRLAYAIMQHKERL